MLRQLFIGLSTNRSLRSFAEHSPMGLRVSRRFVAGTKMEDVLTAARELNARGMSVSMDHLGENVTNAAEAKEAATVYHRLLDEIAARKLNANISVKLTHMGLDVDANLAREIVCALVAHATSYNNFVRVDMEGSPYTQQTLDMVHQMHAHDNHAGHVGTVIQAYLYRSEKDVRDLLAQGIRIRLCKGAYREPADIAFQKKSDVDANYLKLTRILLTSGIYHGIATHDERIIRETIRFAQNEKIDPKSFEFQMLYGIRRDLQEELVREGWGMRVYIPFGTEWYPYFMRRLAERPANVLFIAKNMFRA